MVDRVRAVGIATCWVWTFRWSNPGGWCLWHSSRPSLGPTLPLVQWVHGLFSEVNQPGRGVYHPPHLAVKLKKELNYTSAPHLGLPDTLWSEVYFCVKMKKISWSQWLTVYIANWSFKFYRSAVTSSHEACLFVLMFNFISRLLHHRMANVFVFIFRLYRSLVYLQCTLYSCCLIKWKGGI